MWKRYPTTRTGALEKVGIASDGSLSWYDTATCYTLHPAAADLQMMTTGIKIVGGAAELPRYYVGMCIDPSGFANAVNNLPGYVITAVAVNGADLDLTLYDGNNTLIAEAAAGARDIRVVCRSIFAYCAAANAASFGGYTNWRIPNIYELYLICDLQAATGVPNATAFPDWPQNYISSSTTVANAVGSAYAAYYLSGIVSSDVTKTTVGATVGCELVR
jgi:hypothetical protein